MPNVALVTCADLPDLDTEEQLVIEPLRALGVEVSVETWDDPDVDWTAFDLTVIRSAWDYPTRRDDFVAWAHSIPTLANPAAIVEWNTDKSYLHEFVELGYPVVPTSWLAPGADDEPPDDGEYVIKPSVSAGSLNTGRYRMDDTEQAEQAREHIARLHANGATVMIQPYVSAVDSQGETSLLYMNGSFSHAIRKGQMLSGPDHGAEELYREEEIDARIPTAIEHDTAHRILAATPMVDELLYARVDLVPDADGKPLLIELELTEPGMFLSHDAGAPQRFANAIATYLSR